MTHVSYLVAGWGITFATCAIYAVSVLRRAKRLSEHVPVERARWMTSKDADRIGES